MGTTCNQNNTSTQGEVNMQPKSMDKPGEHSDAAKLTLAKYFPGNLRGRIVEEQAYKKLSQLGFTSDNTLFGNCSCPDEINHNDPTEDITSLFRHRWG